MTPKIEKILILAKTYPSPSAQYCETSCIAGINEQGEMRRIYPVPFRLLSEEQRFSKWQWIEARTRKSNNDHRPESFRIDIDTLECKEKIPTTDAWAIRRQWLKQIPTFESFTDLQNWSTKTGRSLALLKISLIEALEIIPVRNPAWTAEEIEKLTRSQQQGNLFSATEAERQTRQLEKLPYDFYYKYLDPKASSTKRHKIVDWEAGALYRTCYQSHKETWQKPFKDKLETTLPSKDLMFLMGNIHRFQDQWLIISLIYPPIQAAHLADQIALF